MGSLVQCGHDLENPHLFHLLSHFWSGCPASARKTPPGVDKYLWMRASSCYRRDVHARGLPDVERQLPSSAAVATLSSSLEQLRQDLQRLPGIEQI
ncbi:SH3 and multiple ankyrin repeat domains protein 3 [Manis javanica]|nr:SH3 and multiple ankyrin repeat domains protein 3 [Manis javanica]